MIGVDPLAIRLSRFIVKYHLSPLLYYFLRFYLSLLRVRVLGEDSAFRQFKKHGRVIVALWHQRFLPTLAYVTQFRAFKPIIMISPSRDGELISRVAERLGLVPVRGSSSKRGQYAFMTVLKALETNPGVIHIVDGPKGPKGVIKSGLIRLAQMSDAIILPVIVSADRAWLMKSWDRFLVPKPFGKVTIQWGEPFLVPRDINAVKYKALKEDIEKRLTDAYAEADLSAGWKAPL
ncbi:MAG: lysophospholipid acyltransferase family protein [Desulfobacterales bacterium]|nr:lysophospholipid acyltransferase family protein [Desulfobacterales bacterium]